LGDSRLHIKLRAGKFIMAESYLTYIDESGDDGFRFGSQAELKPSAHGK
jgi:hypothetical protein